MAVVNQVVTLTRRQNPGWTSLIFRLTAGSLTSVFVLLVASVGPLGAQTIVRPGFNLFSVSQDVEAGRQSAAQVEQQIPILSDATTQRYVAALGARLAAHAPGAKFAYRFKVANLSDLNAFALPGGYIYVHRGLISQVRTEGELAGVMAHEIAHVALRHPTNQASKAYLAKAGLGVLGGRLAGGTSTTSQIVNAVGGFGMNSLFMKFSRSAESQADIVGSQIMAKAGYDPNEMATFFGYMAQQSGGNPGSVATFLSDHPAPTDRQARVRQEAALLGAARRTPAIGSLATVKARLNRLAPARTSAQVAQNTTSRSTTALASNRLSIDPPSTRFRTYRQRNGSFSIEQPENWSVGESADGMGVTILPRGGLQSRSPRSASIVHGVIVNHFVPFDGSIGSQFIDTQSQGQPAPMLEQAVADLVRQIHQANPYLDRRTSSDTRSVVAGASALEVHLAGQSPATGRDEQVTIVARELEDGHIVYLLLIAPTSEAAALKPTFDRMVRSLRVDNSVAHD